MKGVALGGAAAARYGAAMTYRARKRLALLILLVALPIYIVAALWILSLFERPHPLVELAIYVALGGAWALPFRRLFLGVARPDPEEAAETRPR